MSKIVCFDTNFQNPRVYESLEALLLEIKGSKNQANRALNEPTNNFRGYKLMEQDKIPEIFSNLLIEREEKIRSEYGDNIEDLEKRLESAEKKVRQSKFKVDDLEDTYTQKFEQFENSHKEELETLTENHNEYLIQLETDFNNKLETLQSRVKADMERVVSEAQNAEQGLIDSYTKHIKAMEQTIQEYQQEVQLAKEQHQNAVERLDKKYKDILTVWSKNVLATVDYLTTSRNNIYTNLKEIVNVLNQVSKVDQEIHGLSDEFFLSISETLPKLEDKRKVEIHLVPTPAIDLEDYIPGNAKSIEQVSDKHLRKETTEIIVKEPEIETVRVELEDIKEPVVKKPVVEKVAVEEKKSKNSISEAPVPQPIVENKVEDVKQEVDPNLNKRHVVRGVTLKSHFEFEDMSNEAKGFYLCSLAKKGVHPEEILHLTTEDIREYIANDPIISEVFVSEVIAQGLKYSECEDYLIFVDAPTIIEKLKLTKEVVDDFLEVKPPTPAHVKAEPTVQNPSSTELPENAIKFNWGKYIEILEQNEDMEELLDQDSLTMRDLQQVIDVPARQASSMMGVLKRLGYIKDFENERVVSRMETIFLIVVSSSHKAQKKNVESLDTLIQRLYPSWILYREKNNV